MEVLVEGEQFACQPGPEGIRVSNGLLIELLVLLQPAQVWAGRVVFSEFFGDLERLGVMGLII